MRSYTDVPWISLWDVPFGTNLTRHWMSIGYPRRKSNVIGRPNIRIWHPSYIQRAKVCYLAVSLSGSWINIMPFYAELFPTYYYSTFVLQIKSLVEDNQATNDKAKERSLLNEFLAVKPLFSQPHLSMFIHTSINYIFLCVG